MMKSAVLFIVVLFSMGFVQSQSWKDSLRAGKQAYQDGDYEQAYQSLLEAQKLAPAEVDLSQDIGNAAYRSQDYEMAEKAFRAAASNVEDGLEQSKHWHNVGNSQMQAKSYKAAVESYKNALRKNPDDEKTRYNLAEAQRRVKKEEQQEDKGQNENQDEQSDSDDNSQGENQSSSQDEIDNAENKQDQESGTDGNEGAGDASQNSEGKLSDRKTDRMLEDLLKKEMETKRKVRGIESDKNQQQVKSGKRW